jgi:hypothetical protein
VGDDNDAADDLTLLVPLRGLLEQAVASANTKHFTGEVKLSEELLRPDVLDRVVAQLNPAVIAFLAFYPPVDTPIADYVKAGSLSSDSGQKVFVLFTTDTHVFTPKYAGDPGVFSGQEIAPGIQIDTGIHPAYEMVRTLFEPDPAPNLPGIALFKSFEDSDVVYVELSGLTSPLDVAQRLRQVFALATESAQAGDRKFADAVSARLQQQRIPYRRTGRRSVREWFIRGYQFLWDNRSDIIAAATPFV